MFYFVLCYYKSSYFKALTCIKPIFKIPDFSIEKLIPTYLGELSYFFRSSRFIFCRERENTSFLERELVNGRVKITGNMHRSYSSQLILKYLLKVEPPFPNFFKLILNFPLL